MGYSLAKYLRIKSTVSEREFAKSAGLSRSNLRKLEAGSTDIRLESLKCLSEALGRRLDIMLSPISTVVAEHSVLFLSMLIEKDGFESWKIHLMNFVDSYRREADPRLLVLPPQASQDERIKALIASTVLYLCDEQGAEAPLWARGSFYLDKPWFVSGMESLKASALLESPWSFRRNNIFVLENFLARK